MKRLTIEQEENPVAQGNYDDTWADDPDMTVKCPHCGAIWERYAVPPSPFNSRQYDWNTSDVKRAYSTHDNGHTPVQKDYCYACAFETATEGDFKSFVEDSRQTDEFREWMVGL
jgi:hypothetical protein